MNDFNFHNQFELHDDNNDDDDGVDIYVSRLY